MSRRCWKLQPTADSSQAGRDPAFARRRVASALPDRRGRPVDWRPQHVDVREDRLVLYGDGDAHGVGTFVYRVRATNAGTFQVPPAFAEGMYDRTVTG